MKRLESAGRGGISHTCADGADDVRSADLFEQLIACADGAVPCALTSRSLKAREDELREAGDPVGALVLYATADGSAFGGDYRTASNGRTLVVRSGVATTDDELLQAIEEVDPVNEIKAGALARGDAVLHDESPGGRIAVRQAALIHEDPIAQRALGIVHDRRRAERHGRRAMLDRVRRLPRRLQRARGSHGPRPASRTARRAARSGDDDCGPGEPDAAGRGHARLTRRGIAGRWSS